MGAADEASRSAVEAAVREHHGRVLAVLVKHSRDFDLAEDVLQDAIVSALEHWPRSGIPRHPDAWLLQAARRKAIDRFRRADTSRNRQDELTRWLEATAGDSEGEPEEPVVDHRLSLIFTCCHPALSEPSRVALTLRTLGGLTTTEIARAFLVPETSLAQRLVRAKRKIRDAGIPYRVPPAELWAERLPSVLAVIYLVFNEGYGATSGDRVTRGDLCEEGIRLGRTLHELAPGQPEIAGLLALMLLHDARRGARVDGDGNLITLEDQDRSVWDREKIAEGDRVLRHALAFGRPGPYQLQAAISAVHATAPTYDATDWREIVLLYRRLFEIQPSPVVRLNEIVAVSFAEGPEAGLAMLEQLDGIKDLQRYAPFWAARADMLRRSGRVDDASDAYLRAEELTQNEAERRFFRERRDALGAETRD
ncbi:hypothetical protein ABI59_15385 [Acidobacteria bacterium Mor1]|nr:hypothetical protein ABI59_15385 [Acidobacteria bacterium Mor1]